MLATKEICALLLAGGLGAGSVVTVQKVKPAVSKAVAAKPASKPKVTKAVQRSTDTSALQECPAVGAPELAPILIAEQEIPIPIQPSGEPVLTSRSGGGAGGGGVYVPGGGGFGGGTSIVPDPAPVPGVPAPDTWVMLVAGFGFLGLALRRSPAAAGRQGR